MSDRDTVRTQLMKTLEAADLDVQQVGEDRWMTMLAGEWKRTIPVLFHLDERSLRVTSLLAGAPDEGHADVYEILLHRNEKLGPVHFALDDEGDIILTGQLPLAAVDVQALDELLGAILMTSDEVFNRVLRAGFATYVEAEQRWRRSRGLPPNPVSSAP